MQKNLGKACDPCNVFYGKIVKILGRKDVQKRKKSEDFLLYSEIIHIFGLRET